MNHVPVDADVVDSGFGVAHDAEPGGNVFPGIELVICADRQLLDVDFVTFVDHLVDRTGLDMRRVDRIGFARRVFREERLDPAAFHAEREAQALEIGVHVGDQRKLGALDVFRRSPAENRSSRSSRSMIPETPNRGSTSFLMRTTCSGVFGFEKLDKPPQIGRIGGIGRSAHAVPPPSRGASIGPSAAVQAAIPPSRWATGARPMSWAVLAASAERQSAGAIDTKVLSSAKNGLW